MSSPTESYAQTYRPRRPSFFLSLAPTTSQPVANLPLADATARPAARRSSSVSSNGSKTSGSGLQFLSLGHDQPAEAVVEEKKE